MPEKKKIKVKVKKRKLKIKRIIITLATIIILTLAFLYIKNLPITNIYIIGTTNIKDKEIIETSNLINYPPFLTTTATSIKNKLKQNKYIKEVKVEKKFWGKIYITITEYKPVAMYNNTILLEDKSQVPNTYNLMNLPIIINDITAIKDKTIDKFKQIDESILQKISEISYEPNEVDKERFLFKMNDGNQVYVTLTKITKINKYNSIYSKLEGKKGIIYLDSGDYVEVKSE